MPRLASDPDGGQPETSTAGVGFGSRRYEAEEARGRAALEKLRDASAERGYDSTLQGLSDRPAAPEPTPEELSEFKSSLTLGFAGFLIVAGIVSLVLGGSLWEPKGFNEDGSPPTDATPAFGFTPKPPAP